MDTLYWPQDRVQSLFHEKVTLRPHTLPPPGDPATTNWLDLAHNLLLISHYSVQKLAFNQGGFRVLLSAWRHFDEHGLDTERRPGFAGKDQAIESSI